MKVSELIAKLQKMPQDIEVILLSCEVSSTGVSNVEHVTGTFQGRLTGETYKQNHVELS